MEGKIKYAFLTTMWKHSSPGGWFFVSLPEGISKEIRANLQWQEEGWGRMKTQAQIGKTTWDTAIWFDSKLGTYLLPIKSEIRTKEGLKVDEEFEIVICI